MPRELDGIRNALYEAQETGLCEVVERANITLEQIFDIFQSKKYENRIALFHYGGHADGYQLLLETLSGKLSMVAAKQDLDNCSENNNETIVKGKPIDYADNCSENNNNDSQGLQPLTTLNQVAHGEGLVSFLAKQQSLKLVFFNGCSTQQQSSKLAAAGVPCVIGTSNFISDDVATELSIRFYKSLGNGATPDSAWEEAIDYTKTKRGTANVRGLYRKSKEEVSIDAFPWQVFYKQGAETVKEWSLPIAVNKADYGLPSIPSHYTLPETPFLFLKRYEKSHARVFFGRTVFIRKLYEYALDGKSAPIMLLHGQSGVGKSSLLDAGLLPRLSQKAEVIYIRRIPELGLLGTLKQALGVSQKEIGFRLLAQIAGWFEPAVKQKFGLFTEEIKHLQGKTDLTRRLLNEFLSTEGTKRPCTLEELNEKQLISPAELPKLLLDLVNRRILQSEEDRYELAHDSLAAAIDRRRTAEERAIVEESRMVKEGLTAYQKTGGMMNAENLKYIQAFLPKLSLSKAEKDFLAKSESKIKANK